MFRVILPYRYWDERKRRVTGDSIMEDFVPFPGWIAQAERECLEYAGRHTIPLDLADAAEARLLRHRWHKRDAANFYACKAIYKKNAKKAALWCLKQQRWVNRARSSYARSKSAVNAALTVLVRTRSDARVVSHYIALAIDEVLQTKAVEEDAYACARACGDGLQIRFRAELKALYVMAILGAQMAAERVGLAVAWTPARPGLLVAEAQFSFWERVQKFCRGIEFDARKLVRP